MFQRAIARDRSILPRNEHNPKAFSQVMLVLAHNFPQTAPNAIANSCASETTRSNKAHTAAARILDRHHIEHQQFAPLHKTVSFHALIL
jgi:hypothetical protein